MNFSSWIFLSRLVQTIEQKLRDSTLFFGAATIIERHRGDKDIYTRRLFISPIYHDQALDYKRVPA